MIEGIKLLLCLFSQSLKLGLQSVILLQSLVSFCLQHHQVVHCSVQVILQTQGNLFSLPLPLGGCFKVFCAAVKFCLQV